MRPGSMFAAAVLVAALAGCGQETSEPVAAVDPVAMDTMVGTDTTATVAVNPCGAVSAEEVSAIAGSPMVAHAGETENDCSFRTAGDNLKLVVKIVDAAGYEAMAAAKGAETVSGLGERAVWVPWANSLLAVKGERMLDVTYDEGVELSPKATAAERKQRSIAVAEKILPAI